MSHHLRFYPLIVIFILTFLNDLLSQNINYQVEVTALRCNIAGDGIFGGPDPTWKVWANDNTDPVWTGGNCVYRDDVTNGQFTLDTLDPSGELPYVIRNISSTTATQITLRFEGFEKDCQWFGVTERCSYDGCCDQPFCLLADDVPCNNNSLATIDFRNDPKCQWNNYGWFTCGSYDIKIRIRWDMADPPVILTQPGISGNDITMCDPTPLTLNVVADSSANYYQWQVSTNTGSNPTTGWTDIPGANSPSYTVPVIHGTQNYRVLITSSCTFSFSNSIVISQSVRVTYQPYPPTPINSSLCGSMVMPNSTHHFTVLTDPDSSGIVNPSGWLWSGSSGLIIHTPNAPATDITFPSYGLYQITVEYLDACTGQNTVSPPCVITVGSSHCDFVYVAPNGTDTATAGTPANPVKTLAYALTMATNSRNTIRMLGGTYHETQVINLTDDVTIDGGYAANNNVWIKSSAETTNIIIDPPLETALVNSANIGFYRGFSAQNASNWTLQDLHISVKPGGATGTTAHSGHSVYGIHIADSCNNYLISRCSITVGSSSAGEDGLPGFDGMDGSIGGDGVAGGEDHNGVFNCDFDANGLGGIGGNAVGSGVRMGGTGGNGGLGDYQEFSIYAYGEDGYAGSSGGGGDSGGFVTGNGGDRNTACTPASGTTGDIGNSGQNGISYLSPASTNYNYNYSFWIPSFGLNGGDGFGGGGGQGGGGSSGQGTGIFPFCAPGRGNGGGGGGSGGEGGSGGDGGGGGGSSFGIYSSGWGNGIITSSIINLPAGPPAPGGAGNSGGNGGNGGAGGLGNTTCQTENGSGGNGGNGGQGGQGGKGQNGASGIIMGIALGNAATINGTSTFIPNPTTVNVYYNNFRGCTNSEIEISKFSGNWLLPPNADYVNDININTSSYNNNSDTAVIYFSNTGIYDIGANNGIFDSFIRITDDRTLSHIIINHSPGCFDSTVYLSASQLSFEYDWRVYISDPESAIFTSSLSAPHTSGLPGGTYIVRLRQRDICCGWSIPVYDTLIIYPEINAGQVSGNQTICNGTSADTLYNIVAASGSHMGSYIYQWQSSTTSNSLGTPGQWTNLSGANNENYFPGILTDTTYFVRQIMDSCGVSYSNVITVITTPELVGGIIAHDTSICEGNAPALLNSVAPASGGVANTIAYEWQYSTTSNIPGTSGWITISTSNNETYQSGILNQTTYFVRKVTDSCGSAYSNVVTIIVDSVPTANAGNSFQLCDSLTFNLNAQLVTGTGFWHQTAGPGTSVFSPNNQIPNPQVHVTQPGTYKYTWVVSNGVCNDSSSITITIYPGFSITVSPLSSMICKGDTVSLSASGATSFLWQPNDYLSVDSGNLVLSFPQQNITYTVTGFSSQGCSSTTNVIITVHEFPSVSLGEDLYFCSSPLIVLDAGGTYQHYLWNDGSTEQTFQVNTPGIYWVVVDNYNCVKSDTITIKPCIDVEIPNVITPNGDGQNDYFYVRGIFETYNLTIFNRWGKKVFETNNSEEKWDGTINGNAASDGTYYYVFTYKTINYADKNEEQSLYGSFMILR